MAEETRRDWEVVQEDAGVSKTDRLRVKGGSLYRTTLGGVPGSAPSVAMVFAPGGGDDDKADKVPDTLKATPTGKS